MADKSDIVFGTVLACIVGWSGFCTVLWWKVKDKPKGEKTNAASK